MFERFTDSARRVIVLGQEEARLLGHDHIGTEHLLLGLLHEDAGPSADELAAVGVDIEGVRDAVREILGPGAEAAPEGHIPFTPRAKKALQLALREALDLGNNYIDSQHILLGLMREGEGVGVQALVRLGVELDDLRERLTGPLRGRREPEAAPIGDLATIHARLMSIEERLDRIERLLRDRPGRDSA